MFWIRDVIPDLGSEFFSFPDPGSRVKKIPDSESASKNLSNFNPKNCFLALGVGNIIRYVHPDLVFLPIPDPVSRGQKGTGSRIRICNIASKVIHLVVKTFYFPWQCHASSCKSKTQFLFQNPRTLLPKFFGMYCYQCNQKNIRLTIMNNLLPSKVKMHLKFDLKGSTYKRKVSFQFFYHV